MGNQWLKQGMHTLEIALRNKAFVKHLASWWQLKEVRHTAHTEGAAEGVTTALHPQHLTLGLNPFFNRNALLLFKSVIFAIRQ